MKNGVEFDGMKLFSPEQLQQILADVSVWAENLKDPEFAGKFNQALARRLGDKESATAMSQVGEMIGQGALDPTSMLRIAKREADILGATPAEVIADVALMEKSIMAGFEATMTQAGTNLGILGRWTKDYQTSMRDAVRRSARSKLVEAFAKDPALREKMSSLETAFTHDPRTQHLTLYSKGVEKKSGASICAA